VKSSKREDRAGGALLASIIGSLGVGLFRAWGSGSCRPGFPYLAGAPLLIAHRGGSALAPENTLPAFRRALEWWGADILELDVQPTRDGHAVVFHDPTLARTTGGSGAIAELDLARVRELDAGYRFTPDGGRTYPFRGIGIRIPTLSEVLQEFPAARVNIEIKDGRTQDAVLRAIRDAGAERRVLIAGERARDRRKLMKLGMPVSASARELKLFVAQLRLGKVLIPPGVDALQLPIRHNSQLIPTRELVEVAHSWNLAVHVWTVDELSDMHLLLDNGVDGIITDRPDRLARVLVERSGRRPPPGAPDPAPVP
jgi:glycerophosphoryl diester phosphodiesterase